MMSYYKNGTVMISVRVKMKMQKFFHHKFKMDTMITNYGIYMMTIYTNE